MKIKNDFGMLFESHINRINTNIKTIKMSNYKMENLIRVERARKRITQAELASELNVSRQTIHSIETGKFVPSTVLAMRIAKFFGVEFSDIFQLQDD